MTKDVADYTIVGCNPAKLIKERFSAEEKDKLLELAWCDWADDMIRENLSLICSENVASLFER